VQVRDVVDKTRTFTFEIFSTSAGDGYIKACKTDTDGKVVEGKHKMYRMSASSQDEKDIWMKCIG
jgi:cytohesin